MAEDLASRGRANPDSKPLVERLGPAQEPRIHRWRFAIAYLALAVVAGGGVGAAIMLLGRPDKAPEPAWAAWRPQGSESTFDNQIAEYVGSRYHLPSGNELVAVIPGPPNISIGDTELAIRSVVIQDDPQGDSEGYRVVEVDDSQMYQLCGGGQQCAIREGTPSTERLKLLRREALELSLYTFEYNKDIDTVIALLPPNLGDMENPDDDSAVALFFERSEFRKELEQPLAQTLVSATPPQAAEIDPREDLIIERLTGNRLFLYQFQPIQAGGAIMHLVRPSSVQ